MLNKDAGLVDDVTGRSRALRDDVPGVFHFDLQAILPPASSLYGNAERLRIICEGCVKSVLGAGRLHFSGAGFHLVSASDVAAEDHAQIVNTALLELFFGTEILNGNRQLFRKLDAEEAAHVLAELGEPDRRDAADEEAPEVPRAFSRPVAFEFAPIEDMQSRRAVAFVCKPYLPADNVRVHGYPAVARALGETLSLDLVLLEESLAFARERAASGLPGAVVATVGYETLARSRSREPYRAALRSACAAQNSLLVLKIADLPKGLPSWRLADVVQCVKPFIGRIFVRLSHTDVLFAHQGFLGAGGFVLEMPQMPTPEKCREEIERVMRACADQRARLCIDNISTIAEWEVARAGGASLGMWARGADVPSPPI